MKNEIVEILKIEKFAMNLGYNARERILNPQMGLLQAGS
jgi:hypothetical protein